MVISGSGGLKSGLKIIDFYPPGRYSLGFSGEMAERLKAPVC